MARLLKSLVGLFVFGVLTTCWLVANAAEAEKVFEINEVEVTLADCPTAVQKTIKREVIGATINEVFEDTCDCRTIYRADVTFDDKKYDIIVAEDGTLLEKVLNQDGDEDDESAEVAFSDLPSAVRKTIKREAHGVKIEAATKQTHCGKTLYTVGVVIEGKNYEVKVSENGTLISKVLDEAVDEEEESEATKDKMATHEETSTVETNPLTILQGTGLQLMLADGPEPGHRVELKIEGKNFEIKATKTGILISVAPDDDDE
jgi:hypothetical protein